MHRVTGDAGSIPGWERSPGGGNGKPTPVFLPRNPMDRGAMDCGPGCHEESDMTEASGHTCTDGVLTRTRWAAPTYPQSL